MGTDATRHVKVKFEGDEKDLERSSGKGSKAIAAWRAQFQKWNERAVKAAVGVAAGTALVGRELYQTGVRMQDLDVKNKTVFEDQLRPMQKWADANRRAFGTSSREVLALAASFADLLKPMGFTAAEAAKMSKQVTELAPALARWEGKGRSAAEVQEILTSAMLGETDALKGLGIAISAADIEARLAAKGQEELTGKARQQAEAIAIQEMIMEKSTDAQKAWAAGGREAAEQQGSLSSAIQTTKERLAASLMPAIESGLALVERFSGVLENNTHAVKVLGGVVIGLAGFVLAANAAFKVYQATTMAVTVATKGLSAAQLALGVAMRANPIGLVITILAALVGALVLAYNKSETFRRIVHAAFGAVLRAVVWMKDGASRALAAFREAMHGAAAWVGRQVNRAVGFVRSLPGKVRSGVSGVYDALTSPFRRAFGWIEDKIDSVKRKVSGIKDAVSNLPGAGVVSGVAGFFAGRRARGGAVTAGRTYLVGERGAEAFTPGTSGHITPNDELGGGDVHVSVMISREEIAGIAQVEIRRNGRTIKRTLRAGGTRAGAPAWA